jgi:thioredoxin reductase (NADPH)
VQTGFDTIIIGAGPAGLTAAIYLARFRRSVLVLDGGPSRADWIPESHNTPGFPQGISGAALLRRLRTQAESFGAEIQRGDATRVRRVRSVFHIASSRDVLTARNVLLATGVKDHVPPIEGIENAIRDSVVRMCPICDAFEAIDKPIAVLGEGALAERERKFLRTYSADVTVLTSRDSEVAPRDALRIELADLTFVNGKVRLASGNATRYFDHLYLALGCTAQTQLASASGASVDDTGNLIVDAHQMTSVKGLYAAGDVVRGLNQIAVAAGEAAIAATDIHNRLRRSNASHPAAR